MGDEYFYGKSGRFIAVIFVTAMCLWVIATIAGYTEDDTKTWPKTLIQPGLMFFGTLLFIILAFLSINTRPWTLSFLVLALTLLFSLAAAVQKRGEKQNQPGR